MARRRLHTEVCDLLGIELPILQAGMGSATNAELVAAVSGAGGLGILGALRRPLPDLAAQIDQIKARGIRVFGVNHVLGQLDADALDLTLDLKVPVLSTAWGDPAAVVEMGHGRGAKVVHQVNTVAQALRAADAGVDVIVAQGNEGGGHVGHLSTLTLVPQIADAVKPVPVLAAGGIGDGRGLAAAMMLGAQGVLVGTRFLATTEAPVHPAWKRAIVAATDENTVASKFYDAMRGEDWPGAVVRTLRNRWIDEWGDRPDEWHRVAEELRPAFLDAFRAGEFPMAGEVSGLIRAEASAADVVREMAAQAEALLSAAQ
jgi:nitronate monooxygenase/enoyl-[acyl-carrier protein] reductase II